MKKKIIVVYQSKEHCSSCGKEFEVFWECPAEGFGYEAQLYECGDCKEIYAHTEEDVLYGKALDKQIANLLCENCHESLTQTLKKKKLFSMCHHCRKENTVSYRLEEYRGDLATKKEVYDLYSS